MIDVFWITRPQADAQKDLFFLQQAGYHILSEPIMTVTHTPFEIPNPHLYDAVVLTSSNALDVTKESTYAPLFEKTTFCVGPKTAQTAEKIGFKNIIVDGQNVQELMDTLTTQSEIQNILYLRGRDIKKPLIIPKKNIDDIITYQVDPVPHLSKKIIAAIQEKKIHHVIICSQRTAEHLGYLMHQYDMNAHAQHMTLGCFSQDIANPLRMLGWKAVVVSESPSTKNLIECYVRNGVIKGKNGLKSVRKE